MNNELQNMRQDYSSSSLTKADVLSNPIDQFSAWFNQYSTCAKHDANAMVLSTVGANNRPSSRVVLLKGISNGGFEFYTNYQSHKAHDISVNNLVSLVFFWPELERQVRVEGKAEKLSEAESDAYFKERPRGSKIGAWTSPQSQVVLNRQMLEDRMAEMEKKFKAEIERPDNWGGYRVVTDSIEFWQGRSNRLHDRIIYIKGENESWDIKRLAP